MYVCCMNVCMLYECMYVCMVSELGECIPCFPDNCGRFGVTGSDLGNGMKKFVKAKRILISPEPVRHLNMCVLSQNPTYIQDIF